jgi:ribosome biogenesis GTPase
MRRSEPVIEQGEVVEIVGRRVRVALPDRRAVLPIRAKVVIGDRVEVEDGVVVEVLERSTVLQRGSKVGVREVCANATALLVVSASLEPPFRPGLVDRVLASAEASGLQGGVVLNKCDQGMPEGVLDRLALYEDLGYPVFMVSALQQKGLDKLQEFLAGHTTVLVGHSGVGKSSLFNVLAPGFSRQIGGLDDEGRGKHTTTGGILVDLPTGGRLVDLPGIREFGLEHVPKVELRRCFPELALRRCRYADCLHNGDDGCVVEALLESGEVDELRLENYRKILEEIS